MISQKEAWKRVLRVIKKSDVIIEVLDARAPDLCRIEKVEKIVEINQKKLILVINKIDLVPYSYVKHFYKQFSKEYPTILMSVKNRWGSRKLRRKILEVTEKRPVIVGIVGYPNVGKSSIINLLKGKRVAGVSSMPGFTRGEQLVKISSNIYLFDTPGVVIPENPEKLALIGAYPIEKIKDPVPIALKILEKVPKEIFKEVYGVETFEELVDKMKANEEIVARKILYDWYKGRLGIEFQKTSNWKKIRALFHPARHDIEEILEKYNGPFLAKEIYFYLKDKIPTNVSEILTYVKKDDYIIGVIVKPKFYLEMKKWLEEEIQKEGKYTKIDEFGEKNKLKVIVYRSLTS